MKNLFLLCCAVFCSAAVNAQLIAPTVEDVPQSIKPNEFRVIVKDANATGVTTEVEYDGGQGPLTFTFPRKAEEGPLLLNLRPKTFYSVRARTYGCAALPCANISPWSNVKQISTLVDFPAATNVTAVNSCPRFVGISIQDPRPGDAQTYIVQKSYGGGFVTAAAIPASQKVYYDNDVIAGRFVSYRVLSENSTGQTLGNPSAAFQIKPFTGPPAPTNLASDASAKTDTQIRVTWGNPPSETECNSNTRVVNLVQIRRQGETEFKNYDVTGPTGNSMLITGLKQKEIVEVRVYGTSDQGRDSDKAYLTDTTSGKPYAPSKMIVVAFKDAAKNDVFGLSWTDNSKDEDYFDIETSVDSVNFKPLARVKTNTTNLSFLNLEGGVKYFFRVRAGNVKYGNSDYTRTPTGVVYQYASIPNKPYGLSAKVGTDIKVSLTWRDDSNQEESYIIERSVDNANAFTELKKVERNAVSFVDGTITAGKTYFYRVKAVNPLGSSGFSNVVKVEGKAGATGTQALVIFPNPSSDFVSVSSDQGYSNLKVNIFDQSNNLVKSATLKDQDDNIDLRNLKEGFYIARYKLNGLNVSSKFFKK